MNNIPQVKMGIIAVSRDCFPISLSEKRRKAIVAKLQEKLPNCVIETETYQSTGAGWREHDRYFILIEAFGSNTYIPFAESRPVE